MKRILFTLFLAVLLSPALKAQELTRQEREKAVKYLEKTRNEVLHATQGLSEAQWNFKPAPDRWSVAEVAEHIAASEDFLRDMVRDKVMTSPTSLDAGDVKARDELVLQKVPDRTTKVQAPEPLRPNRRFGSPEQSLKHFKASRAQTIVFLKKTPGLRQHAMDSPIGQKLDGYEWVLLIAAHSERHTKQIDEVKADPGFPKK